MKTFIIERNIPSVGKLAGGELQAACCKSNVAIAQMDHKVQWQHSYVTKDKLYCVYLAPDREAVQEHSTISGFPADRIEVVENVIDPATGT